MFKRKRRHLRPKTDLAIHPTEIRGIIASHVGNAANLALSPKQAIVVELRNPVEVNGVDGNHSSLPKTGKGRYDHIPAGGERHCAIKLYGRFILLAAYPDRPQRSRQSTVPRSSCRHVHLTIPRPQHRNCKMRRRTDAKQSHSLSILDSAHSKAAKTNNARAQQRSAVEIIKRPRNQ